MKPKLIIHIGPPKTGTTSLQHYFLANRERHQPIFEYPTIGLAENTKEPFAHHNIARCLSVAPRARGQFSPDCGTPDELLHALEQRQTNVPVLLSSEGFWGLLLDSESRRAFEDYLLALRKTFDVTLLATWRNAVDFALSMYFHGAKRHIPAPFPFPLERITRFDHNFWRNVSDMSAVADHVCVVKYSKDIVGAYIRLLSELLEQQLSDQHRDVRENQSFNTAQKMFALACSMTPDAFNVAKYRRVIQSLKTADFSDTVQLTLDKRFDELRQQSEQKFAAFKPDAKITIVGSDDDSRSPRWTPQIFGKAPFAAARSGA